MYICQRPLGRLGLLDTVWVLFVVTAEPGVFLSIHAPGLLGTIPPAWYGPRDANTTPPRPAWYGPRGLPLQDHKGKKSLRVLTEATPQGGSDHDPWEGGGAKVLSAAKWNLMRLSGT